MGFVQAIHTMNLTTTANYARAHPPKKFAGDYAGYFKKDILPFLVSGDGHYRASNPFPRIAGGMQRLKLSLVAMFHNELLSNSPD
jgi:hypothetical protein